MIVSDVAGVVQANSPQTTRWIWYAVIFMAAWNAVLRPSVSTPVTPYYVLMPILCLLLITRTAWAWRWFFWFLIITCYGLIVGVAYGVPLLMQAAQLLKYAQLVTFFVLLIWLCRSDIRAPERLHRMVWALTICVFAIAGVQAGTGLEFPTVVNEESGLWLNAFFFTPNDLALFLCGVLCIVLCGDTAAWKKGLFFVAFLGLSFRNDAKAAILASLLMISMHGLVWLCIRLRIKPVIGLLVLLIAVPIAVVVMGDITIEIGDSEFNFMQLFQEPFDHIVRLEPYNLGGSVFDRTDALIYAIDAMKTRNWLGLGPAGSVYMLSLPNSELLTAKSLHNAIAEVLVEFGPVALWVGFFLFRPFGRALLSSRPSRQQISQMCLIAAAPMLAVSQSSGYISNYAFWLTAFLIWYPLSSRRISSKTKGLVEIQCRTTSAAPQSL